MFGTSHYKDIFNQRAALYHEAMHFLPHARDQEFITLLSLADLQPNQAIIDMPSGGGYLAQYMPVDIKLFHLEISEQFANLAHDITSHPMLLVEENHLPFEDNSIDRFLSLAGLHHIEDKTPIFKEIQRVLKPGGKAVIADAYQGSPVASFLDQCVNEYNPMGHQGIYLSDETINEMCASGLTVTSSDPYQYIWQFPSLEHMVEYCRKIFGMSKGRAQDIEQSIAKYLGFNQESNHIQMNWALEFIQCIKK